MTTRLSGRTRAAIAAAAATSLALTPLAALATETPEATPEAISAESMSDEQMFFALLMTADLLDAERQRGLYSGTHALLAPVYVTPPEEDALVYYDIDGERKLHPRLWQSQPPEGVPYIKVKGNEATEGRDGFYVIKPSKKGCLLYTSDAADEVVPV